MNKRLEAILEAVTEIVEAELVTGEAARKKAGGKLPSTAKIKAMRAKAKRNKEIRRLEIAERKPQSED
jgi:hypothetical protein